MSRLPSGKRFEPTRRPSQVKFEGQCTLKSADQGTRGTEVERIRHELAEPREEANRVALLCLGKDPVLRSITSLKPLQVVNPLQSTTYF